MAREKRKPVPILIEPPRIKREISRIAEGRRAPGGNQGEREGRRGKDKMERKGGV